MDMSLKGKRIAIPENRQLDLLVSMLKKRGAEVLRCPLVAIYDTPDTEAVVSWIHKCIEQPYDDLILLTGEGLRRLISFAKRYELDESFVNSLGQMCLITRGPKPVQALKLISLKPNIVAEQPTTEGVIATLGRMNLEGCRVAVQLYGDEPNLKLINYLESRNVQADTVAPYVYAAESEDEKVSTLIGEILNAEVDAIAFTSQAQLRRLLGVAIKNKQREQLSKALNKIIVAAVGPVMAAALQEAGIKVDVMPEASYFMKPMVIELTTKFTSRR